MVDAVAAMVVVAAMVAAVVPPAPSPEALHLLFLSAQQYWAPISIILTRSSLCGSVSSLQAKAW